LLAISAWRALWLWKEKKASRYERQFSVLNKQLFTASKEWSNALGVKKYIIL
jgi:hypothetical protein